MPKQVYWAVLIERTIHQLAFNSLMNVSAHGQQHGYHRLSAPYTRPDVVRNLLVEKFLSVTSAPDDTLVMLDNDHIHPDDVLERLLAHDKQVVGALAFRRGEPYFPCAFLRDEQGVMRVMENYPKGLVEVSLTGTGAIAIQRQVFTQLEDAGYAWPYFRYIYHAGDPVMPSEDIYFGECCESAEIQHYLDTTLVSPHITDSMVDESSWRSWVEDHPEVKQPGYEQARLFAPRQDAEAGQ